MRISQNQLDEVILDPCDILESKGIYYISGEIETGSLIRIQQDIILKHLDPNWKSDIQIIVNSVGGDSSEGWALIDLMNWVKMDFRTVGLGQCCSLGACLVAAGTKGKRVSGENTSFMVHGAFSAIMGNKQDMASSMKSMEDEHRRDIDFWVSNSVYRTPKDVEKNLLNGKDVWMTAKEAKKVGLIDHIYRKDGRVEAPPPAKNSRKSLKVQG